MKKKFTNDNNVAIKLIRHNFSKTFSRRYEHEIFFRRIISFFLKRKLIKGNIIDLGAWIGDNAIPWAKNINHIVYAIDPSSQNIEFITKMCLHNDVSNIKTIFVFTASDNYYLGRIDKFKWLEHDRLQKVSGVEHVV